MATPAQVSPFLYAQLSNDSRSQTLAAGASWTLYPLSFFYGDEISVDLGIKATMLRILSLQHTTISDQLWANLRNFINRSTLVKDAINIIAQISSAATH